jgi:AhpD family alkylhydroperoxidase
MAAAPRVPMLDVAAHGPAGPLLARVENEIGGVPHLYRVLGHHPALLQAWIDFGWGLRAAGAVDRGTCELVILRVAQLTGSDYVWCSHRRLAVGAGVTDEQIDALATATRRDAFDGAQRAALALADQLTLDGEVGDDVWVEVRDHLGTAAAVELVVTVGWYAGVARVAAALAVPPEDWHQRVPGRPGRPREAGERET